MIFNSHQVITMRNALITVIESTTTDSKINIEARELLRELAFRKDEGFSFSREKDLHITEKNFPEQTKMCREILDKMYQTHLDKNADYSPANIKGTGMSGIATRFWDKTARLMNLLGFDIYTGAYTGEKEAKNESIEDSFIDSANYSIIALIFRAGKWGK